MSPPLSRTWRSLRMVSSMKRKREGLRFQMEKWENTNTLMLRDSQAQAEKHTLENLRTASASVSQLRSQDSRSRGEEDGTHTFLYLRRQHRWAGQAGSLHKVVVLTNIDDSRVDIWPTGLVFSNSQNFTRAWRRRNAYLLLPYAYRSIVSGSSKNSRSRVDEDRTHTFLCCNHQPQRSGFQEFSSDHPGF